MSYRQQENEIMSEDLYRDIILEHYARPPHRKRVERCTHSEEGFNPTCGDEVELEFRLEDGVIQDIGFQGQGCSICLASASMLTTLFYGQSLDHAKSVCRCFKKRMLDRNDQSEPEVDLQDLEALDGVRQYPVRIKCALLPWNTFLGALDKGEKAHA